MNKLLLRLLALFCPGIADDLDDPVDPVDPADPEDPDEPVDPDEPTDPADPEDPTDPEDPHEDPEPAPRETRAQRNIRETRERAQRAEADRDRYRTELEAARRQPAAQPAQPTPDQVLWQQEEETLRNPETSDWQRYSINAARSSRQAQSEARAANARAEDMGDRADFNTLAAEKPAMYKAYKDKVEDRLKEIRARGQNAPRMAVLKVLLGEDMLAGKLKTGEVAPRKATTRTPAPRSDVTPPRGAAGLSDAEKRARRLENVRI